MGLSGDAVHTRPHAFFPRIPEGFHDESATAPGGGSELGLAPCSSISWEETAKTFSPTEYFPDVLDDNPCDLCLLGKDSSASKATMLL